MLRTRPGHDTQGPITHFWNPFFPSFMDPPIYYSRSEYIETVSSNRRTELSFVLSERLPGHG